MRLLFLTLFFSCCTTTLFAETLVPVFFPDGYDGDPAVIRQAVDRAQGRIDRFAADHGWEEQSRPLPYDSVEVFARQDQLKARLAEMFEVSPEAFPAGVVTVCEKRILMAVSPEEYAQVTPHLAGEQHAWEKLLAHEIAHRLHVAILDGDEEAMGPTWFFEGFATLGAGQFAQDPLPSNPWTALSSQDYRDFVGTLRYLTQSISLPALVRRAGEPDFEDWLKKRVGED